VPRCASVTYHGVMNDGGHRARTPACSAAPYRAWPRATLRASRPGPAQCHRSCHRNLARFPRQPARRQMCTRCAAPAAHRTRPPTIGWADLCRCESIYACAHASIPLERSDAWHGCRRGTGLRRSRRRRLRRCARLSAGTTPSTPRTCVSTRVGRPHPSASAWPLARRNRAAHRRVDAAATWRCVTCQCATCHVA
jgi:hypothetical protein